MSFSLKNLIRGVGNDLNPFDNGKSHGNQYNAPPPASTAQPQQSTFKPLDNSITRGISRGFDQVNMFDNNRTWQNTNPTNNRGVGSMLGAIPKAVAKPFWETADTGVKGVQLGAANITGNTQAADNARLRRDQSYQQSLIPTAVHTYNRLSDVPIVGDVVAPGKRQAETNIENRLKEAADQSNAITDSKVREIQAGINSGIYDKQKGSQAINQLLVNDTLQYQALQDAYDKKLANAGFDRNTSKTQMFGSTAGDLANLASFAVAPATGAQLAAVGAEKGLGTAVTTGLVDIGTNSALGGIGNTTSALGQGANWQEALKAGATGTLTNAALMGAGYLKGVHAPTINTIAGKSSPNVTTKLVNKLKDNYSFDQGGYIGVPGRKEIPVERYATKSGLPAEGSQGTFFSPKGKGTPDYGPVKHETKIAPGKMFESSDQETALRKLFGDKQANKMLDKFDNLNENDQTGRAAFGYLDQQITKELRKQGYDTIHYKNDRGLAGIDQLSGEQYVSLNQKNINGVPGDISKNTANIPKIHPQDQKVMADFIDHVRGVPSKMTDLEKHNMQIEASNVAEHYKIGTSAMSPTKLANAFDNELALRNYGKLSGAADQAYRSKQTSVKAPQVGKTTVYHGTNKEAANSIRQKGFDSTLGNKRGFSGQTDNNFTFVTPNKTSAKYFADNNMRTAGKGEVVPAELNGKLLKIDGNMPDYEALGKAHEQLGVPMTGPNKTMLDVPALKKALSDSGYVGIEFKDRNAGGRISYAIADNKTLSVAPQVGKDKGLNPDTSNKTYTHYTDTTPAISTNPNRLIPESMSLQEGKGMAGVFGKNKFDFKLSPDAKIFKVGKTEWDNIANKLPDNASNKDIGKAIGDYAKKQGYDGIRIDKSVNQPGLGTELAVFNKDKLVDINKPKSNQGGYIAPGQIASDIKNKINKIKSTYSFDQTGAIGKDVRPKDLPIVGKKQSSFAKGVTKSNEISPELQAKVKTRDTTYTPTNNADQVKASKTLVNKGYKKAATDVTSRLEVKTGKINAQDVADTIHVIKELDKRGGEANLQQATNLSERLSEHLTKQGQSIQAASILNNRTPEGMAYGARKFLKSHNIEVTPEIQKTIKSHVDEIAKLKPGEARNYKIAELQQKISTYVPSSKTEKAIGLWKAGLLTGVKTQTGNTLSGIATNVLKTASDAPAAALDTGFAALGKTKFGKSLGFTGERSKVFTLRGKASGTVEGAKKGWTSLKTGIDERNIEANKFDTKRLVFSDKPLGRAAQKYTDSVYGLMGAADRPNYYANLRNNLYDLAIVDAKNKGLKGSSKQAHISQFVKEPPMKALETANKAADTAIFANDTQLSKWAGSLRKAAEGNPAANAGINIVMPFTKVPSSVAMRLVDYSPIGAVKTIGEQIKNVKKTGKIDQRALSEGLAQSGVGTGTMWLGAQLHQNGLMTGAYPTDQKEQELWKLEGKQPNSIKVNGKWQSINYTSPIGQVLAVGAKVNEAKQAGQSTGGQAVTGAFAIPKTVSDQSFLQGVQGLQDAVNDPLHFAPKLAKSQTSSLVPTIVSDVAKATDPLQRQSNSIKDAVQAKIPGLNQKLLPKQNAFGENLTRQSSAVNTLANPFRPSDVKPTNDLNTELRRLQDQKLGVMPSSTNKQLVFGKETINLTPQQLFDKNSTTGKKIKDTWNSIIKTPEYQKMSDSDKQKALRNSLSDINALSKNEFAAKNKPELLDSQKLSKGQIKLAGGDASNYLKTSTASKTTTAQDKVNNDYKVLKSNIDLTLSRAKSSGDVNGWLDNASKQYNAIENYKKTLDPNKDQVQINSLTKQQDTIKNNAIKYKSQGGFTKAKKAKASKTAKAMRTKGFGASRASGTSHIGAVRNIVKGIKYNRKRITA